MYILQLQTVPWDKIYNIEVEEETYQLRERLIIKTESCLEMAFVVDIVEQVNEVDEDVKIIRRATQDDLDKMPTPQEKRDILAHCYQRIKYFGLEMKLVDLRFSLDNSRITFAFTANGRIDFRELVKDLSSHFNKNIRLQQIGVRDEAKLIGDVGRCGRKLCCKTHLAKFFSVTGDMAEVQQLAIRGSDRISGICGRLMCCLAYEADGYKAKAEKMPPLGAKVNVDGQRGEVISHNILKESVNVKFFGEKGEDDYIDEVDLNRNKKKKES